MTDWNGLSVRLCLFIIFLLVLEASSHVFALPGEMTGTVTHIVDGDTFEIRVVNGTKYIIRMADVNESEIDQSGYDETKAALDTMIFGKTLLGCGRSLSGMPGALVTGLLLFPTLTIIPPIS